MARVRSPRAASRAATSPAGPPPTMRTSQSSTCTGLYRDRRGRAVSHREREHGAGGDALLTPCADWRVYIQSGPTQHDRAGWTERQAQAALITSIEIDDGNTERGGSHHRARRYGDA